MTAALAAPAAPDAPDVPRSTTRPTDTRDPWFDNAKMLLVTLVVVGHSWVMLPDRPWVELGYDWLYLWHIPAFVMVTGYLSRRFTFTPRNLRRLVTTVVVPYVLFEGLMALFRTSVGDESLERPWLDPHWPMWYLAALFFWRLLTPLLRRTSHALPIAVGVSLVGGIAGIETFDLARVMGLLPFFVVGLLAEERHLAWLRSPTNRRLAVGTLLVGALLAPWVEWGISTGWLYYSHSYADLETSWPVGMAIRATLLVVSGALALAVLALVPQRHGWFTRLGAGSLVVYLFHGFFVKGVTYAGYPDWAAQHAYVAAVVTTVAAVALAMALSWRPVRKPLQRVVTPIR